MARHGSKRPTSPHARSPEAPPPRGDRPVFGAARSDWAEPTGLWKRLGRRLRRQRRALVGWARGLCARGGGPG